jgi:hypothetical protein
VLDHSSVSNACEVCHQDEEQQLYDDAQALPEKVGGHFAGAPDSLPLIDAKGSDLRGLMRGAEE